MKNTENPEGVTHRRNHRYRLELLRCIANGKWQMANGKFNRLGIGHI